MQAHGDVTERYYNRRSDNKGENPIFIHGFSPFSTLPDIV